jgi:hypothetical protein
VSPERIDGVNEDSTTTQPDGADLPRPVELVMPDTLAARPRDSRRGVPIPAFADRSIIGVRDDQPDFNKVDHRVVKKLASRRWCYVCGEPIPQTEDVFLLGDESSYEQAYYPESFGHEACMLAALTLCPWIASASHKRATERALGQPRNLEDDQKPVVWVLASSRYMKYADGKRAGQRRGLYPKSLRNPRFFGYDENDAIVEIDIEQANRVLLDNGLALITDPSEPPAR